MERCNCKKCNGVKFRTPKVVQSHLDLYGARNEDEEISFANVFAERNESRSENNSSSAGCSYESNFEAIPGE